METHDPERVKTLENALGLHELDGLRRDYVDEKRRYAEYIRDFRHGVKRRSKLINEAVNRPWNSETGKLPYREYNQRVREMKKDLKEYRLNGKAVNNTEYDLFLKKRKEYTNRLDETIRRLGGEHNDLYMEVFALRNALKTAEKQYKKRNAANADEYGAQYNEMVASLNDSIAEKKEKIEILGKDIEYIRERYPLPRLFSLRF